jgi:hypothetical protein
VKAGRKPTCSCGECPKCKRRDYAALWYSRKTPEERQAMVAKRDPEKVRAADRARYYRDRDKRLSLSKKSMSEKLAEDPDYKNRVQRRQREQYPERFHARYLVNNAIRYGRLSRGDCEVCGSPLTQAHHDDYGQPMSVRWLCSQHHYELHRQYAK